MLGHLIKYHIKKWIPLFIVSTLVLTSFFGIAILSMSTSTGFVRASYLSNAIISAESAWYMLVSNFMFWPALVLSFVLPLFIFQYRTNKREVDSMYQAPYSKKTIRRTLMLMGLTILILSITIAAAVGSAIYILRYIATPAMVTQPPYGGYGEVMKDARFTPNFGFLALTLVIVIVLCSGHYFINCLLVGLGNYGFDQICLLIFGNMFMLLCVTGPSLYVEMVVGHMFESGYGYEAFYGLVPLGEIPFIAAIYPQWFQQNYIDQTLYWHTLISTCLGTLVSIFACVTTMMLPDPSGEYAGSRKPIHPFVTFIPHMAALAFGFLVSLLGNLLSPISEAAFFGLLFLFYVLYGSAYYALLSLWRLSFKPKKIDLICFLVVMAVVAILMFYASVIKMNGPVI